MRLHPLAAMVGLTLALAGCASDGNLHPHAAPLDPAALKTAHSLAGVSASAAWPTADWWAGLHDARLDALIHEALADNPSLAEADARAHQAQALAGLADAARQPSVGVGASVAEARIPTTVPGLGNGHAGAAKYVYGSFKWEVDLWGGKRAAWEAAVGQARAAEVDARAARIELSINVARAYVQLGQAYTQRDLAQDEMQRAEAVRKLTVQRVAAGLDNQLQLQRDEAAVAGAQEQLAVAARGIDAAQTALAVLLGKGPDRGRAIARPQPLAPAVLAVPAALPVELIGHRADLTAARWRVEATGKSIKAAKTAFLPNLDLGVMAGLISLGGENLFQLPARFYNVAPSISLPVFDGGRLRANLSGKDAQYELAVAQYNQALVRAVNEVADEVDAQQSLGQQMAAQQRALAAAREAWQLAEQRHRAGVGSYLESLGVRQQLLLAEQRMAALAAQSADQSLQLIQALGGGYRPQDPAPRGGERPSATPATAATSFPAKHS